MVRLITKFYSMLANIEVSAETEIKPKVVKELLKDNKKPEAHEISDLMRQVCSKFSDYDSHTSKELKNALNEIKRLQSFIHNLKKRPCSKCTELAELVRSLKTTLKEKDDTIAVVGKLLTNNPNQNSYALASQMVNDVIMKPAVDLTYFDSMFPEVDISYQDNVEKTPEKYEKVNPEVSPVVLKRTRSNKRRFLSISSKKKNKTENGDTAADSYGISYLDDDDEFAELSLLNIASGCLKTPENCNGVMGCITPLSSSYPNENTLVQSPEILNETIEFRNDRMSSRKNRSNSDEKAKISPEARDTDYKFNPLSIEKKPVDSAANNLYEECLQLGSESKKYVISRPNQLSSESISEVKKENYLSNALSPLNVNVLNNVNFTFANSKHVKNTTATELEKQKQKTVWNLKKSRELTSNKKLKQTVLSTMVREKKVDISTLKEYTGGSIPCSQPKSPEKTVTGSAAIKENIGNKNDETFFDPLATSTSNILHSEPELRSPTKPTTKIVPENKPISPEKKATTESTNKNKTPVKNGFVRFEDSFDYIPSKSPNYAYRRDAVRKKSERLKLPGQECDKCIQFYKSRKDEMSDSQIKALLNKCSRHRDKYAIRLNTPPGLWNPVFDDTDEDTEMK